jgi:hypothetical protein
VLGHKTASRIRTKLAEMAPAEISATNQTDTQSLALNAWLSLMLNSNDTLLVLSPLPDQAALSHPSQHHSLSTAHIGTYVKSGYENDSGKLARLSDGRGAVFYIIIVIMFYSLPVAMIIVSRINKIRTKQLEDRQIHKYLQVHTSAYQAFTTLYTSTALATGTQQRSTKCLQVHSNIVPSSCRYTGK